MESAEPQPAQEEEQKAYVEIPELDIVRLRQLMVDTTEQFEKGEL